MKKILLLLIVSVGITSLSFSQNKNDLANEKRELTEMINNFMNSIKSKDSAVLYNLFFEGNVTWVGVYKENTQQSRLKKDSTSLSFKSSDFKTWFRSVIKGIPKEEKFYNVIIDTDGYIASVTFDFSFWAGHKKGIWGKESWGLVKINNQWKITSVIYSMEQENIIAEPNRVQN